METIDGLIERKDSSTLTDAAPLADSIFFERTNPEFRKVLRKKLITFKHEKQTLEESISAKNTEIDDLKKSLRSLNEVINSVPIEDLKLNSSIASAENVELNKKNRQLHSDLDSVKNRNTRLESKLKSLETELKKSIEEKNAIVPQKCVDGQLDDLQMKLKHTKQKLFDSLNQNVELKNQLKLAQKCIQQEIGENMNLNILAASGSSWRGRAQQILTLQLKVNELKAQMENIRSEFGWPEESPSELPPVRRDQINHRIEVESLQNHIASLTTHIEDQNQKIAALKVRNTNLVSEVTKFKEKCIQLESLVQNNDGTISQLKENLENQTLHYEAKIIGIRKQVTDTQSPKPDFELQSEQMQISIEKLEAELDRKEETIGDLKETIKKLEQDLKSICGDYLFECRDFKKEEFAGLLDALESEKNNLLELNKTMNQRLDSERIRILGLIDQISRQKVKICRLEGKIRDLEKEHASQSDKKRRCQRIAEYASSINSSTCVMRSFVFEKTSFTDIPSKNSEDQDKDFEIEELKNKLEVSKEKITILENKLNYLNEEKQIDTQTFENIIKMSKSVLLDTIRKIKTGSSSPI